MSDRTWENRIRIISGKEPEDDRERLTLPIAPKGFSLLSEQSMAGASAYASAISAGRGFGKSKLAASLMSSFESDAFDDDQLLGSGVVPFVVSKPSTEAWPIYLLPNGEVTLEKPAGDQRVVRIGYARMVDGEMDDFQLIADVTIPPDFNESEVSVDLPVERPSTPKPIRDRLIYFELE